ncbi:MAG: hypothetical protein QM541_01870 [Flavobacterium sp.]|nr:hypothetical protein [Flavobacterium sp.]
MRQNKPFLLQPQGLALLLIIAVPAIVNQMYSDKPSYQTNTTDFKNFFEVGIVTTVGFIGYFGLRNLQQKWPLTIWKATYILTIAFLLIAAFVEAFIYKYSYNGQFRFMSVKQMLFSPIIYVLLLIIYTKLTKKKSA